MSTKLERDWKEAWVDRMGLIVTLSGMERMTAIVAFKADMQRFLTAGEQGELQECLRKRFTPSNGSDGCQSATEAVKTVTD